MEQASKWYARSIDTLDTLRPADAKQGLQSAIDDITHYRDRLCVLADTYLDVFRRLSAAEIDRAQARETILGA